MKGPIVFGPPRVFQKNLRSFTINEKTHPNPMVYKELEQVRPAKFVVNPCGIKTYNEFFAVLQNAMQNATLFAKCNSQYGSVKMTD
jgi:hypothetical protein